MDGRYNGNSVSLGSIENPQIADIAGAVDYREQKLARDEAKRKEIRTNEIMGKALSSGLREGSPMYQLALDNPQGYLTIAKHMGINPEDGSGMQQMTVDANIINKFNATDPTGQQGISYMQSERDRRDKLGLNVDYLDKGIQAAQTNFPQFQRATAVVDQTWNPPAAKEDFTLGDTRYRGDGKVIVTNPKNNELDPYKKAQMDHWNKMDGDASNPEMDNAITDMATRIIAGEDKSKVIGNFGRGQQGAADLRRLEIRMAELRREKGVSTSQQLANQQDVGAASKAVKDFDTGKQGNNVRSFNTSLRHLDTLSNLSDALNNGDAKLINKIGNLWNTQTGEAAPVNFEAAKKIVADEIVKAIVGSGGGVADREEAAHTIDAANSPAQLKGVIGTYKELMAGQLKGLKQQYETSTGRKDFHKYLSEEAKPYIEEKPKDAAQPTVSNW